MQTYRKHFVSIVYDGCIKICWCLVQEVTSLIACRFDATWRSDCGGGAQWTRIWYTDLTTSHPDWRLYVCLQRNCFEQESDCPPRMLHKQANAISIFSVEEASGRHSAIYCIETILVSFCFKQSLFFVRLLKQKYYSYFS